MAKPGIDFSNLLFFGDSLTDNGNLYGITGGGAPTSPPYAKRFSNGETYAEILPGRIGVTSADAGPEIWGYAGDDNFAIGGARAVTNTDDQIPDLAFQLAEFQARYAALGGVPPNTAALLLIGNNDYFNFRGAPADAPAFVGGVLQQVGAAAGTLAAAGVSKIILLTLPNVASTPLVATTPAAAGIDALIDGHNAGLRQVAAGLAAQGVNVEIIDNNAFVREIAADAETFGFKAPLSARLLDVAVGAPNAVTGFAADEFAFWDDVHPTAAAHGVSASFVAAALMADATSFGTAASETKAFGAGRDLFFAGAGNDLILARDGNDTVFAGTGNDRAFGGNGDDVLAGGSGNDLVLGDAGIDVVAGNAGNDILNGGAGDDVVIAGTGNDILLGGLGNDRFYIENEASVRDYDYVDGGVGRDTLVIELSAAAQASAAFQAEIAAFSAGSFFGINRFSSIGVAARSIERVDVVVNGAIVQTAGADIAMTAAQADAVTTADLWGFI